MLSLSMIVKNEEKYLDRCLKSVSRIVDEMIVVDTGSTDRTKEIARSNGASVFDFPWCDDFSAARNFSIERASGNWILVLDADEYFAEDCSASIFDFIRQGGQIGEFESISKFGHDGEIQYARYYLPRLFPSHVRYTGIIHEQLRSDLPMRVVPEAVLLHDGYFNVDKTARNLPLLHKELQEKPTDVYVLFQLGKEYGNAENYEKAEHYLLQCYQRLTRKEPYGHKAIVVLLDTLAKNKNFRKAMEIIRQESAYMNDVPDFHFSKSVIFLEYALQTGDFSVIPEIEQGYLKCLELGSIDGKKEMAIGVSSYMAAHNLAVFYETTGNTQKAIELYSLAADRYRFEPSAIRLQGLKRG